MISWFNSWAQGIILAVIIVTILEMIVPEGKNKKYIKIVMGVYITFTIISPIITKVTGIILNLMLVNMKIYLIQILCKVQTKLQVLIIKV